MKKVDLHIHSYYSDGTYSPKEIIEIAKRNGVGRISIADHNTLDAYQDIYDESIVFGVEIDSNDMGYDFHILGYNYDLNEPFINFVHSVNEILEKFNEELIEKISKDEKNISIEDYRNYNYSRNKGGWKLLHYLVYKGLSKDLWDSFKYYKKYDHSYDLISFPSTKKVVEMIHQANGIAILAHPGRVIHYQTLNEFEAILRKVIIQNNLDGIECYYPSHTKEVTDICLKVCHELNLMITCGSDCHGTFENTRIGELNVTEEMINLR